MEYSKTVLNTDPDALVEAIKPQLREMIATWSMRHPGRILMRIPVSNLELLAGYDSSTKLIAFEKLDGYVGARLIEGPVLIPWSYELRALLLSGAIEVLLRSKELHIRPLRCLADEIAYLARDQARAIDIDEVFDFSVPISILDRIEKMRQSNRTQFRATLNRRLAAVGLSAHGGTIAGGLEIRRNR